MKNCTCVSLIWQFSSLCWCSQDYDVCFLASGIVEDGAVPVFSFEFTMFVRPELIFQWESLFFVLKHIETWFFNESLCFFGFSTIESWFLNESLVFWCQAYWKWIFQWKCLFFGLRPFENGFFNETVCFFGLRHCGRRCSCFLKWIYSVFKTWINFSMRVFVFLVSGLLKPNFNENLCFFGLRHCGRRCCTLFPFECIMFLGPLVFSMRVFVFWCEAYWK